MSRSPLIRFSALAGVAVLACVVCRAATPARVAGQRAYHRAMTRLAKCRALHVKVHDQVKGQDSEYWFQKPNRYKVIRGDGSKVFCDGRQVVTVTPSGGRTTARASRRFPEDVRLMDFRSFFDGEPVVGELMGKEQFTFGGVTRPVYWVKTTESAIEYGQAFLAPDTMLPVGHRTTERDEVSVDLCYAIVQLNPALRDHDFLAPGR